MASRDKVDVDTFLEGIQYALEKLGKSKFSFERTTVSTFKSKRDEGSGNELVDYSRAPCLGADQKARGLWARPLFSVLVAFELILASFGRKISKTSKPQQHPQQRIKNGTNFAGRYIEMRMRRVHLTMRTDSIKAFSKRIRRCSAEGRIFLKT